MLSKTVVTLFALTFRLWAANAYTMDSVNVLPGSRNPVLIVNTKGSRPSGTDEQAYGDPANWKVYERSGSDGAPVKRRVASVSHDYSTQEIDLTVEPDPAHPGDGHDRHWTVLFTPPETMAAVPFVLNFAPVTTASGSSGCDPAKGFLCPVSGADQANLLLSGSFVAGGYTKPIYALKEQVSLYTTQQTPFRYGVQSLVCINQSASPPNNRTRFDPNSISAAFSLYNLQPIQSSWLYGIVTTINPAGGEFSRSDPSANFIASFQEKFVLTPVKTSKSTFVTLYPVIGMEGGENLDKPGKLQGVPANLTGFSGIARGVLGSEAAFAVEKKDRSGSLFSIQGTWRVRVPAFDEPFVIARDGVAHVSLTDKARNWVEVDVNWAPPGFKYVALNARYQYGSLPPIYNLVDHLVTFGLTLQAKESAVSFLPK